MYYELEENRYRRGESIEVPSGGSDAAVDIKDLMVYHKSVFDMCNDILSDLHRLRYDRQNGGEFAERVMAASIPLTSNAIAKYVIKKIEKQLRRKRDVLMEKRSPDELADSSRAVTEFGRMYNFGVSQTVDEITDVLMTRLLVDTVKHFSELL